MTTPRGRPRGALAAGRSHACRAEREPNAAEGGSGARGGDRAGLGAGCGTRGGRKRGFILVSPFGGNRDNMICIRKERMGEGGGERDDK